VLFYFSRPSIIQQRLEGDTAGQFADAAKAFNFKAI